MKKLLSFINKYYVWIVGFFVIVAIASRLYRLKQPDWQVFDEIYYSDFAQKYLNGETYFDVHHPFSKSIISIGIIIFGNNVLGWRIMESIFGFSTVIVTFLIAYEMFKDKFIALFSLILATCSTMLLVESRLSLINIFLAFFIVLTTFFFFHWLNTKKTTFLILSTIVFALALSIKWTAAFMSPVFIAFMFSSIENQKVFYKEFIKKPQNLFFLLYLPILTYWILFFLTDGSGYGFFEWHKQAFNFHNNLSEGHPYSSNWYTWLIMLRPICLEYKKIKEGKIIGIIEIGNMAIFWTSILAMIYSIVRIFQKEKFKRQLIFIILAIVFFMIPWAFIKRISFIYLFLPAVPFLILLVSFLVKRLIKSKLAFLGIAILILSIGWFAYFYPIVAGIPVTEEQYQQRMWFKSWI
ncbi:MAG: phospholipid carrier-dependent glycosyltransferase [Candidatus Helarchaeota archaeon]